MTIRARRSRSGCRTPNIPPSFATTRARCTDLPETPVRSLFGRAADHAAAYREAMADPIGSPCGYAEALAMFDAPTPLTGQPADAVLEDLVATASAGLRAMTGPRFFGWVIGASHPMG